MLNNDALFLPDPSCSLNIILAVVKETLSVQKVKPGSDNPGHVFMNNNVGDKPPQCVRSTPPPHNSPPTVAQTDIACPKAAIQSQSSVSPNSPSNGTNGRTTTSLELAGTLSGQESNTLLSVQGGQTQPGPQQSVQCEQQSE